MERNKFCQSVLVARQRDGFLPSCGISDNVCTYHPRGIARQAKLVIAGFPCQACGFGKCSCNLELMHVETHHCQLQLASQDVSAAGTQAGLQGARSCLVREPWRIHDELEDPSSA